MQQPTWVEEFGPKKAYNYGKRYRLHFNRLHPQIAAMAASGKFRDCMSFGIYDAQAQWEKAYKQRVPNPTEVRCYICNNKMSNNWATMKISHGEPDHLLPSALMLGLIGHPLADSVAEGARKNVQRAALDTLKDVNQLKYDQILGHLLGLQGLQVANYKWACHYCNAEKKSDLVFYKVLGAIEPYCFADVIPQDAGCILQFAGNEMMRMQSATNPGWNNGLNTNVSARFHGNWSRNYAERTKWGNQLLAPLRLFPAPVNRGVIEERIAAAFNPLMTGIYAIPVATLREMWEMNFAIWVVAVATGDALHAGGRKIAKHNKIPKQRGGGDATVYLELDDGNSATITLDGDKSTVEYTEGLLIHFCNNLWRYYGGFVDQIKQNRGDEYELTYEDFRNFRNKDPSSLTLANASAFLPNPPAFGVDQTNQQNSQHFAKPGMFADESMGENHNPASPGTLSITSQAGNPTTPSSSLSHFGFNEPSAFPHGYDDMSGGKNKRKKTHRNKLKRKRTKRNKKSKK